MVYLGRSYPKMFQWDCDPKGTLFDQEVPFDELPGEPGWYFLEETPGMILLGYQGGTTILVGIQPTKVRKHFIQKFSQN